MEKPKGAGGCCGVRRGATSSVAIAGRTLSSSQERRGGKKDLRRSGTLVWRDRVQCGDTDNCWRLNVRNWGHSSERGRTGQEGSTVWADLTLLQREDIVRKRNRMRSVARM